MEGPGGKGRAQEAERAERAVTGNGPEAERAERAVTGWERAEAERAERAVTGWKGLEGAAFCFRKAQRDGRETSSCFSMFGRFQLFSLGWAPPR